MNMTRRSKLCLSLRFGKVPSLHLTFELLVFYTKVNEFILTHILKPT